MVVRTLILTVLLAASAAAVAVAVPGRIAADDIDASAAAELIRQLSDADPAVRARAERELTEMGAAARAQLTEAAESPDPELAARAAQILMQLPWARPDDEEPVRRLLENYGALAADSRRQVIERLIAIGEADVVLRVLGDEPTDDVRWWAAAALATDARPAVRETLAEIDPADVGDNAPLLILAGYGRRATDPAAARELFRRAIAIERSAPSVDAYGLTDEVIDRLIDDAVAHDDADEAAELLRLQIARGMSSAEPYGAIGRLFALHAAFGPLDGYASDLRTYGPAAGRPTPLDRATVLFSSLGVPAPRVLAVASHAASDLSQQDRSGAARLMFRLGRLGLAEQELRLVLANDDGGVLDERYDMWSLLQISDIAAKQERFDDAAAALEDAMALQRRAPRSAMWPDELLGQMIRWHRMRAAHARGDLSAAGREADALLATTPANADIALDMIPVLEQLGRTDDADRVFDAMYADLKAQVEAMPDEPSPKNNLAWLCARSGRHLDEALALATQAIELAPHEAAFLDTAAEANFRVGNIDEAIHLEQRALESAPHDAFMKSQLERFRAARDAP